MQIGLSFLFVGGSVAATFGALAGRRWGALHAGVWRLVHGADRTRRASALVALGIGAEALLAAAVAFALLPGLAAFLVPIALFGAVGGAWWALREWEPAAEPAPRPPTTVAPAHDGLSFTLPWRPAWASALLTVLAIALPVPMSAVAALWSRRALRTRVRLRGDELEVVRGARRTVLPLHFARVDEGERWDGTPVIRVGDGEIPVGGAPPGEVAWAVERLRRAAVEADPVGTPVAPDALRRVVQGAGAGPSARSGTGTTSGADFVSSL